MKPSIKLAQKGIEVSHDLNFVLNFGKQSMLENPVSKAKFYDGEDPHKINS